MERAAKSESGVESPPPAARVQPSSLKTSSASLKSMPGPAAAPPPPRQGPASKNLLSCRPPTPTSPSSPTATSPSSPTATASPSRPSTASSSQNNNNTNTNNNVRPASPGAAPSPTASSSSFAQRKARLTSRPSQSRLEIIVEGNNMMRDISRPPPADVMSKRKSHMQPELAKRKSAYYDVEFQAPGRESDPSRDRIRNEAIVLAEFRTNLIINDEFSFLTDLSYVLSNRYQRPISSIVISIQHSCCMMFGGTFEPAYTLAISALPGSIQPTMNRRNAALVQGHLQDSLAIPPARGHVRFLAIEEENSAVGGKTVAGELDDTTGRGARGDDVAASRPERGKSSTKSPAKTKARRMLSVRSFRNLAGSDEQSRTMPTPPSSADDSALIQPSAPEWPPSPPQKDYHHQRARAQTHALPPQQRDSSAMSESRPEQPTKPAKTATRRKSFVTALFSSSRGGTVKEKQQARTLGGGAPFEV